MHNAGLVTLTHTPAPMHFLNEICGRPESEKPLMMMVVRHPVPGCRVPAITPKPLDQVAVFR